MPDAAEPDQRCQTCKNWLSSDCFKADIDKRTGKKVFSKSCTECAEANRARAKRRRAAKAGRDVGPESAADENVPPESIAEEAPPQDDISFDNVSDMPAITVGALIDVLGSRENVLQAQARVIEDEAEGRSARERADALAASVGECMKYRFIYQSKYTFTRSPCTRFVYRCAQLKSRQRPSKKSEAKTQRDKTSMNTFDCHGWLHIMVWEDSEQYWPAWVSVNHENDHIPYWKIDVPIEVQDYVASHSEMRPNQLWDSIIHKFGNPTFSRKAIYNLWAEREQKKWRLDPDPMVSAQKLIAAAVAVLWGSAEGAGTYGVETIPLPEHAGVAALAFSVPDALRKWGGKIRELLLDSAWNTNGSGYEIYAIMGEVHGSGCPLAYLLINIVAPQAEGTKEEYIRAVLRYLRDTWKIRPLVTLTDKDWSEINACRAEFPASDHEICLWHAMRAIKKRLPIKNRAPAYYDVNAAAEEFDFIDKDFVPVAQMNAILKDTVSTQPSTKQLPKVNVILGGQSYSQAPPPSQSRAVPPLPLPPPPPPGPVPSQKLIFSLNGVKQATISVYRQDPERGDGGDEGDADRADDEDSDDEGAGEGGQLLCILERHTENLEADITDVPDWAVDPDERKTKDPAYVFCPSEHRKQILHTFVKHYCLHPIFPERERGFQSAEKIRRESVWEMYDFCHKRGLREVWGYLWANWYSPKRWPLWARSTCARLPRLRTTMTVENFWKQLKHNHLHHLVHPRLDHLVFILIHNVTPNYFSTTQCLSDIYRLGRSKKLTSFQKYLKSSWQKLRVAAVSKKTYETDLAAWTCNCGRQKYHAYHLCKHLVQATAPLPADFWQQIVRRRVSPIYRHPALVPRDSPPGTYIDPAEGSITDGDDNVWSGDRTLLEHGHWRKLLAEPSPSPAPTDTTLQIPNGVSADEDLAVEDRGAHSGPAAIMDYEGGASDDERERETEELAELVRELRETCFKMGPFFDDQLQKPPDETLTFFRTLKRKNIGHDLRDLCKQVEYATSTGRTRDTTWVSAKARPEKRRRVANLLGFHPSSSPAPSTRESSRAPPSSPPQSPRHPLSSPPRSPRPLATSPLPSPYRAPSIIDVDDLASDHPAIKEKESI